jgi:hypothetical protein
MIFELLPNEILMECFEYFTVFEIFYSFDQLNYRFYQLIRTIPLNIDFQYVEKSIFDQFCMELLINSDIKRQIYSLKLSNNEMTGQIQKFLSLFSLDEFSQLQSLTLIEIKKNNVNKLITMLPFISKLYCFRLIDPESETEEILNALPTSKLQTLLVSKSVLNLNLIHKISSIVNLTLSFCSLNELCELFQYTPMLKYLDVRVMPKGYDFQDHNICRTYHPAIQLKTLIVKGFKDQLDDFEIFVKLTPNINTLIITKDFGYNLIDAYRWEHLITSSLSHLNSFQFRFSFSLRNDENDILDKFKQFQSDFWHKQHHWYTEYSLSKYSAVIYTIPYLLDIYTLKPHTKTYSKRFMNNSHTFNNVKELILYQKAITSEASCYFSNVRSLVLDNCICIQDGDDYLLNRKHIQSLKMIVNLSYVKHVTITSSCQLKTASVLLQLLKQTKQLSSLTIDPEILEILFIHRELCKYLGTKIKKLDIYRHDYSLFVNSHIIEQFCQVFSNLEQLKCIIGHPNDLLVLLTRLSKLSSIKALMNLVGDPERIALWFEDVVPILNTMFHINVHDIYEEIYERELFIWIGRNFLW